MENRGEKRHAKSVPVIFSPFSTQNWCPNQAEVGNFSTNGMLFMSNRPLPRESTIHVRIEMDAPSEEDRNHDLDQFRTVTLAEVKWCKPAVENSRKCFGVGVRYLNRCDAMKTGGTILVSDDESPHRYLQACAFGSWGYDTCEAGHGRVALKMIRGNDFFPSRHEKRLTTLRKIMHRGMARLASKWPYLSDRLTRSFAPLEFEEIPWAEVSKTLNQSKIAVVTTTGLHHRSQEKFDMNDPHGDPSFRVLDTANIEQDYTITHDYYDHRDAERDLNVVFPVSRLKEMQASGFIGALAERHFSFMGHIEGSHIDNIVGETAPRVAAMLHQDRVDAVLLTPG